MSAAVAADVAVADLTENYSGDETVG